MGFKNTQDYIRARKGRPIVAPAIVHVKLNRDDVDYDELENDWIDRYFAKTNGDKTGLFMETNKSAYNKFKNGEGYWLVVHIRWRVLGTKREVEFWNKNELEKADETINDIGLLFPDLSEFAEWQKILFDGKTVELKSKPKGLKKKKKRRRRKKGGKGAVYGKSIFGRVGG